MKKRKLPNLGHRIPRKALELKSWALKELSIDQWSGLGFKGKILSGKVVPRPYQTKKQLNKRRDYTCVPYVPKTLFAHWAENNLPCYFYSDLRKNELIINIDFDNKQSISSGKKGSCFWNYVESILEALGLSNAYTQRSTNGKGTHSYISLILTEEDWIDCQGNRRNLLSQTQFVKKIILKFQKTLRNYICENLIPLTVDILGLPAEYDSGMFIIKRGTWVKLPFDMDRKKERIAFLNRQKPTLKQLIEITNRLSNNKKTARTVSGISRTHGSIETEGKWDIVPNIKKFFGFYFGDHQIPFHVRSILTSDEFSDYCIAIELASRVVLNNKNPESHWRNSIPVNLVKQIFLRNKQLGNNFSENNFDHRKFRFIFSFLLNYKLIDVINLKHSYSCLTQDGEIAEGIARKWFVNNRFFTFFSSFKDKFNEKALLNVPGYSSFRGSVNHPQITPNSKLKYQPNQPSIISENRAWDFIFGFLTFCQYYFKKLVGMMEKFKNGLKFHLLL